MKKSLLKWVFIVMLCSFTSCGNDDEPGEKEVGNPDDVKVHLTYTFETSLGGDMSRAATTNEDVFNEFYDKIKTGELLAPSYDITFTNVSTGEIYKYKGNWADNKYVTLRTGTYKVTGYSTAEGKNIQDKCSIFFEEQINISLATTIIVLNAEYDSSLLIFNDEEIQTLYNYNGEDSVSFFSFSTYKYAFVNDCVYNVSYKNEAYISGTYTNNAEFKIYTGSLNFEKGKYYVYNSVLGDGDENTAFSDFKVLSNLEYTDMVAIEGGSFMMGAQSSNSSSANYDYGAYGNESPVHQVTLDDFYIGKYEVTQQLWEYVMTYSGVVADGTVMSSYASDPWLGSNPSSSYGDGNYYPAYKVSYNDIVNIFIPRLNKIAGKEFRLPTEAEWEYAARGGNRSQGYKYSGSNTIGEVAWYYDNSSSTQPVGTKAPNELGIYDMSGNVREWCSDWYSGSYYSSSPTNNPTGPTTGSFRVSRGGARFDDAVRCRVASRGGTNPGGRDGFIGFRLVCSAE